MASGTVQEEPAGPGVEGSRLALGARAGGAREGRYSQSLGRGLAVLRCYTPERALLGVAEVADELGMGRSTTHRYMSTLLALGYLEQVDGRKYRLGLRVSDLGLSVLAATGLARHSHEPLGELREGTGCTAVLAILDGPHALNVDRVVSHRRGAYLLERYLRPGGRFPVHASAVGKLLLAHLQAGEQEELLAGLDLVRYTPGTITSETGLRGELAKVLQDGVAVSDQEYAPGMIALAAPVRGRTGRVIAAAAIAAHTTTVTLDELTGGFLRPLVETAEQISTALGHHSADEYMPRR